MLCNMREKRIYLATRQQPSVGLGCANLSFTAALFSSLIPIRSCLRRDRLHLHDPLGVCEAAYDHPRRRWGVVRLQVLLPMRPYILETIGISRIHIEPDDVLRSHAGVGENRQGVLPDLIMLRLEAIRNGAVRPDANLACREEPAGVWGHLDGMTVLRRGRGHGGRIARLEHG